MIWKLGKAVLSLIDRLPEHTKVKIYDEDISCGADTWSKTIDTGDNVIPLEEIERLKRDAAFEQYCKERDAKLFQADLDRLSSDEPLHADDIACR